MLELLEEQIPDALKWAISNDLIPVRDTHSVSGHLESAMMNIMNLYYCTILVEMSAYFALGKPFRVYKVITDDYERYIQVTPTYMSSMPTYDGSTQISFGVFVKDSYPDGTYYDRFSIDRIWI